MPRATAHAVGVSPRQRGALELLVRRRQTPQQLATRARIILAAAAGESNRSLAARLGITRDTAQAWRARWRGADAALRAAEAEVAEVAGDDRALEATVRGVLADAPRSGAPPTFTAEQLCQIVALACEEAPRDSDRPTSHWTPREIASEAVTRGIVSRISVRTVGRFLVLGGGRAQAPPEPVLAHPSPRRPGGVRRAGADHL